MDNDFQPGDEITFTVPRKRRPGRTHTGPVVAVKDSGWLTVRSRQTNMIFAVQPSNPAHNVRPV